MPDLQKPYLENKTKHFHFKKWKTMLLRAPNFNLVISLCDTLSPHTSTAAAADGQMLGATDEGMKGQMAKQTGGQTWAATDCCSIDHVIGQYIALSETLSAAIRLSQDFYACFVFSPTGSQSNYCMQFFLGGFSYFLKEKEFTKNNTNKKNLLLFSPVTSLCFKKQPRFS